MRSGHSGQWDRDLFAEWLRIARARKLPRLSQRDVERATGIAQAKLSRWENPPAGDNAPPTLHELAAIVDFLGGDFLELARMTGQWDDDLEKRVLVALASKNTDRETATMPLSHAGVAQRPGRVLVFPTISPEKAVDEWADRPILAPVVELGSRIA